MYKQALTQGFWLVFGQVFKEVSTLRTRGLSPKPINVRVMREEDKLNNIEPAFAFGFGGRRGVIGCE
ncbi:hypothetical protein A3A75_03220 [Candidatus Woesebacteria bacterium RIFCSPLOWO2_01_FULL_39_10]|uniref:Uncharacterized protein n=1 Tax=Candidatus Woesebacteria bacterium RIFCSPLOWO2_01_FULL_39_10 TaxID=1802516 RepID=A0A1F8B763_9BACT|nr:MAG: hypothetical protein A3A75_03220 [Candidatus Woesebacteria bacterium RIFCSPLOWO2_01_FULL_39_10]